MAKNWTEEEEDHIRQSFLTQTYGELAEHFGVTTKAMESKIRRMGLKKQELLAEASDPLDVEPVVRFEEPVVPEEPRPTPIESIHKLQRRMEVFEETDEERAERLEQTRVAAETEKARREEARTQSAVAQALKKFESGVKYLMQGKRAQAEKQFQAILDAPPNDLGLVMRARQYLAAATEKTADAPKLKTAEDLYQAGVVLLNEGDFDGALEVLEKATKAAPDDDRILYVLGSAYAAAGNESGALESLAAAIEANEVNRVYARNDPDLSSLYGNPEFQSLIAKPDPEEGEEST